MVASIAARLHVFQYSGVVLSNELRGFILQHSPEITFNVTTDIRVRFYTVFRLYHNIVQGVNDVRHICHDNRAEAHGAWLDCGEENGAPKVCPEFIATVEQRVQFRMTQLAL